MERAVHLGPAVSRAPIRRALDHTFHGRAFELYRLRSGLHHLDEGVPMRQAVIGEAGSGKSSLVAEAISIPKAWGYAVRSAAAVEVEADRPFGILSDALDLHSTSADSERAAVGDLLRRAHVGTRVELYHELGIRIAALVERLASSMPVVLVLEDVQWADRYSVLALRRILETSAGLPCGVLLTRRLLPFNAPVDELIEVADPPFERLDLDPLDADSMIEMAEDWLGNGLGPRLHQLVVAAGGNPSLLVGLLSGLTAEGSLRTVNGVVDAFDYEAPPQAMRPAVMARLRRLTPSCQDLLTIAAVLGGQFVVATLAAVASRTVVDVLADLREALSARILVEDTGALKFRHELVQDILYEETPLAVRASLHLHVAQTLHSGGAGRDITSFHLMRASECEAWATGPFPSGAEKVRRRADLHVLTKAERDVAWHVGEGMSNKQVGERLNVSPRTVETHLAHVFAKLGLNSRVDLARALGTGRDVRGA